LHAAAAQAGGESWTAWFLGSADAITVDKTRAALWVMGLPVRIFGLSSWSSLVPQALMGITTVGLLYAAVRRTAGHGAGLLAGAALALTPVAVLMFRFDNPDALLTLLLVGAAYATRGRNRLAVECRIGDATRGRKVDDSRTREQRLADGWSVRIGGRGGGHGCGGVGSVTW
jgi:hypothetical protein